MAYLPPNPFLSYGVESARSVSPLQIATPMRRARIRRKQISKRKVKAPRK